VKIIVAHRPLVPCLRRVRQWQVNRRHAIRQLWAFLLRIPPGPGNTNDLFRRSGKFGDALLSAQKVLRNCPAVRAACGCPTRPGYDNLFGVSCFLVAAGVAHAAIENF
jgi:hypothetical protein